MSIPENMSKLGGNWAGTSRLWLSPEQASHDSKSTATAALAAKGKFTTIQYTWAYDAELHEGLLLFGFHDSTTVKSVWIDSWHMSDKFMLCHGSIDAQGLVSTMGSYPAASGPDWGWRTVIDSTDSRSFKILMYNVTPDGMEALAVSAEYVRRT